jgi:lipopolysaccharide/colanic/teichoic acid biosynthesis glycosyltransferase
VIRFLDILFSSIAILVLLPFMIPIMVALKLTAEHYIFFAQYRVGRFGKDFKMMKFATMLKDSPNMAGGTITQKNDPRVLPMGRFLRKTKINELPQLWNILTGTMSFVGPRPLTLDHYMRYSNKVRDALWNVRPGLTGIASIVFHDEEGVLDRMGGERDFNHNFILAAYKGALEEWYSKNRTVGLYFLAMALTAFALAGRKGMYKGLLKALPEPPKELSGII